MSGNKPFFIAKHVGTSSKNITLEELEWKTKI